MEPESEIDPPNDEGNEELFYVYLDDCAGCRSSEMSFMESID